MKFAICNELFEGWDFARVCQWNKWQGYDGLELAPFTLAPLITELSKGRRSELKRIAEDAGIEIIGLHWLLAKTTGFHINTPDKGVREKTAQYLVELTHACADLGGKLLVFGSPAARNLLPGVNEHDAYEYAADTFRNVTKALEERGVTLALEPLSPAETDFMLSADDGRQLINMVGHPNVRLHLDVKAMSYEGQPIEKIIDANADLLAHFHANDKNLRGPGMGEIDFVPIFAALLQAGYDDWVSVEVFDFKPDPETIAAESLAYMKRCLDVVTTR